MSRNDIEGEITEELGKEVAPANASDGAVVSFNPMDAEPVVFAKMLQRRSSNYDQLQMHLRGVMVAGKDFGKIHVMPKNKCQEGARCTNEYHFSPWTLFAPGADKILGILGLAVHYPDLKDIKRAVLQGHKIEDIIADAHILGLSDQVIAEGAGACSRNEMNGDLNRTIKRACKRARLDAVLRLPVVSALFESDFLEQIAAAAERNGPNSTAKRTQTVRNQWDTGAILEVCPIGKEYKGMAWRDIDTSTLEWLVANVDDKPDIKRAAEGELSKRIRAADPGSICSSSPPASDD